MEGWIYTLHLQAPLGRGGRNGAQHYTGWTSDLLGRLLDHRAGRGAKIMAACSDRGITWHLAALRRGTRTDERRLKRQHGASRWCWACQAGRAGE
jgi:hypothetical protein